MRIVHLSTSDIGGGAARAAFRLHTGLRRLGHESTMLVAKKGSNDPNVIAIKPRDDFFGRMSRRMRARRIHRDAARYPRLKVPGIETFSDDRTEFAGEIVDQLPPCDLINLHWVGWFLDYESFFHRVPKEIPLVWRLADMAGLTGGCHYTQGCEKFTAKCGACPQLESSNDEDLSRQIWQRKKSSLSLIRPGGLQIVGTSQWIAAEARRSSLLGGFPISVIPNGLDTDEFAPRDKMFCRDLWGIPRDANVVMFAAEAITNQRKGLQYLVDAMKNLTGVSKPFLLSVGGGKLPVDSSVPYLSLGKITSDRILSSAYSAADIFVIPSLQESFGQTVIESLACGTPVVGFAAGGIPDMVRPGVTGWLSPTGDTPALRNAIVTALNHPHRAEMSENCRRIAVQEYSLNVQANAYARLYETMLAKAPQASRLPAAAQPVVAN